MKAIPPVSALLLCVASLGAQAQGMAMTMKPAASAGAHASLPVVDAEIRKLDPQKGSMLLKHGEIPNLGMGPMTMGFQIADKKMLKGLKVGDKVKFRAEMVDGKATVTEVKRVP